jgi:hypothetical protein
MEAVRLASPSPDLPNNILLDNVGAASDAAPRDACASANSAGFAERPLLVDPAWDHDEDLGLRFGLAPAPDLRRRSCRNVLIGSLLDAVLAGAGGVFYSRDKTFYARNRNLLPPFVSLRTLTWAIDTMAAAPLYFLSRRVAPARPRTGQAARPRSSLWAGPDFLEAAGSLNRIDGPTEPAELVLLRDGQGRSMPFQRTAKTKWIASVLERYNAVITDHAITYMPADGGGRTVRCVAPRPVVAIFNRDLTRGGRVYRGRWMSLSKSERASLRIDGEPVVEEDYSSCHFRLLLAAGDEGELARDLAFDPYRIEDLDRQAIKLGILILLNAADAAEAEVALDRRLAEKQLLLPHQTAAIIIAAVHRAFPKLAPAWSSGLGLQLMHIDATMCVSVMERLLDEGILCLTIHDSFIVPVRHRAALQTAMDDALELGFKEAERHIAPLLRRAGLCGRGLTSGPPTSPSSSPPSSPPSSPLPSLNQRMRNRAARMLAELEILLIADPRSLDSRIRLAAVLFGTLYPLATDLAARTRAFFARCCDVSGVDLALLGLNPIVAEVGARGHFRISTVGAAGLAAAPLHLAKTLGLDLLKLPAADNLSRTARRNLRRRLRRQGQHKSPRIVDLERARPWEVDGVARSTWYARHQDRREHQLLGLQALLQRGDSAAVAEARREIDSRTRNSCSQLLARMQRLLNDLSAPDAPVESVPA